MKRSGNKPKPNDRIPYAYYELEEDELYDFKNKYKSGKRRKGQPKKKIFFKVIELNIEIIF